MQPERTRSKESWKGPKVDTSRANKVFVGGIPHSCGEAELREYFKKFGLVTEVVMIYDAEKQRPRGFGFITFEDEQSVDQAVNMHFHDIMGKKVEVKRAEPRDSKILGIGQQVGSQWGSRAMLNTANGWTGQPAQTWQQGYATQGGYGPPPPGRGALPPSFTSYIVSTPSGFATTQGYPQGYPTATQFGLGNYPQDPSSYGPTRPLHSYVQAEQGYSAGYGQDLSAFGQGFSELTPAATSYGAPSAPAAGGPATGGSGFGRGQNHNVQGFHPYRR
ncbi:DAZ-associated protein 1 isoform X2 [Protopterus annectens]|uniref:DAZ-associated protein 1 isoform X2 n=1 Tax=Protopterus annectens TaxID=7888 RepID=UPI001CFC3C61|nr:DAZ-associated protein 1 isoform X2 [Protopterus annectens]